jgi:hypothetical protein
MINDIREDAESRMLKSIEALRAQFQQDSYRSGTPQFIGWYSG